jgi:hypothetical protein
LEKVFDCCVEQLGRDHVILIANVEEIRQKHRRAALTGVPTFSDQFSNAENKRKNAERLKQFETKFRGVLDSGGADYDFEDACAETVMKVLGGEQIRPGCKVIPRTNVRNLFFCLSGHGGSAASLPRTRSFFQKSIHPLLIYVQYPNLLTSHFLYFVLPQSRVAASSL